MITPEEFKQLLDIKQHLLGPVVDSRRESPQSVGFISSLFFLRKVMQDGFRMEPMNRNVKWINSLGKIQGCYFKYLIIDNDYLDDLSDDDKLAIKIHIRRFKDSGTICIESRRQQFYYGEADYGFDAKPNFEYTVPPNFKKY